MPWTDKQKQIAARACTAAGIKDEHRKLILRQCSNSLFDRKGRAVPEPTSTSARLNQSDYDHFMATVEAASGGRIQAKDGGGNFLFSWGYWTGEAAGEMRRQKHLVTIIADTLALEGHLKPDGVGLAGWIRERVTGGRTDQLDELQPHEMSNLIEGLKAFAKRHGIHPKRSLQEA